MPSLTNPVPMATSMARAGRRHALGWVIAAAASLLLAGCDARKIEKLEEGVSTEADVRRQFGEPSAVFPDAGGGRTLEFTRQPEGQTAYMISIGADGRMSALRQVLRPDILAQVAVGFDKGQVRRLIGAPARMQRYELKQQEEWDWRYLHGTEAKVFVVTFDNGGRVVSTASLPDPRVTEAGGPSR